MLVAIVTACSVFVAILISCFLIDTVYEATTTIMIRNLSLADENDKVTNADVQVDESLIKAFVPLVHSDLILKQIISNLTINADIDKLRTLIKVDTVSDTGFIKITAWDRNLQVARDIATTVVEYLQVEQQVSILLVL